MTDAEKRPLFVKIVKNKLLFLGVLKVKYAVFLIDKKLTCGYYYYIKYMN